MSLIDWLYFFSPIRGESDTPNGDIKRVASLERIICPYCLFLNIFYKREKEWFCNECEVQIK